jgi:mono/diheme cytochrome c family protein
MKMIKIINFIPLIVLLLSCKSETKTTDFYGQKQQVNKESIDRGKVLYNDLCVTCHLADGKGVEKIFPPLAGSDYLKDNQNESIKAVKYGMSGEITVNGVVYNSVMTPMGLTDEEVADVMNYINNAWGNRIKTNVTPEMVAKISN